MQRLCLMPLGFVLCFLNGILPHNAFGAEPVAQQSADPGAHAPAIVDDTPRVTLEVARDRARLMHEIYAVTLDVMHERYFRGDNAVVPARALEDVFSEIRRQSKTEARWIAVNLRAMSIDHEPETDFEKQAAKEIAQGKADYEVIEAGYYRRAGSIPLTGGCISCHEGFFSAPSKTQRYAALVISIPIVIEPQSAAIEEQAE